MTIEAESPKVERQVFKTIAIVSMLALYFEHNCDVEIYRVINQFNQ